MKYYGKKSLSQVLLWILNIMLVLGIGLTILLYYNTFFKDIGSIDEKNKIILGTLLTIGVVCIFLIVIELRKIVITLIKTNPFVWSNVTSLKRISVECFIIAACYFGNLVLSFGKEKYRFIYLDAKGIHTDTEPIIFILAGIFIAILAGVFKKAIEYKEENDFTI